MLDKVSEVTGNWHLGQNSASRNNGFQRCGQDKRFFKFSRGVFNFWSISVVDSISVMSKYIVMQF